MKTSLGIGIRQCYGVICFCGNALGGLRQKHAIVVKIFTVQDNFNRVNSRYKTMFLVFPGDGVQKLIIILLGFSLSINAMDLRDNFDYPGVPDVSAEQTGFWDISVVRQDIQPVETGGQLILQCQNNGSSDNPTIFLKHDVESSWDFFSKEIRFTLEGIGFSGTAPDSERRLFLFVCPEKNITYNCDDGFFLQILPDQVLLNIKKNEGVKNYGDGTDSIALGSSPTRVDLALTPTEYKVMVYTDTGEEVFSGSHGLNASDWTLGNGTTQVAGSAVLLQAKKESAASTNSVVVSLDRVQVYAGLKNQELYFDSGYSGIEFGTSNYPYHSLSNLDGRDLFSGTVLKLKRDAVFDGGCSPSSVIGSSENPIVFEAYGTGADPIVRGTQAVTGWTDVNADGIWEASFNEAVSALFLNGEKQVLARYPNQNAANEGWLAITAKPTADPNFPHILVSTNLKDAAYWMDATCVVRAAAWEDSVLTVTNWNNPTKTLYFDENLYKDGEKYSVGFGFYLQNVLEELDAEGEWFFDGDNSTLYFKKPAGVDLSSGVVDVSVIPRAFDLPGGSGFVEFHNLRIESFQENGIYGSSVSDITVESCNFRNNGHRDIVLTASSSARGEDLTIQNSVFQNSKAQSIYLANMDGFLIEGNTMDDGYQTAILVGTSSDGVIRHNTIRNVGYNGIHLSRPIQGILVESNLVDGFCTEFTDGGAYYVWDNVPKLSGDPADASTTGPSEFRKNIARDGHTEHAAVGNSGHNCYGFYLDDNARLWTVTDNIVVNPGNVCFNLHNARENEVAGNLLYGGSEYTVRLSESSNVGDWWYAQNGTYENMSSNRFFGNVFYMNHSPFSGTDARNVRWKSQYENPDDMIQTMESNLYCNLFGAMIDSREFYTNGTMNSGGTLCREDLTLEDHQAQLGLDGSSVGHPLNNTRLPVEVSGVNQVSNSNFSDPVKVNNCWPRNAPGYEDNPDAWVTLSTVPGVLDGDCLKAVAGNTGGSFWMNEDGAKNGLSVVSGRVYRIHFTMKSEMESSVGVSVIQDHGSKLNVGCSRSVTLGTARQDYDIYFTATLSDDDVRIAFPMNLGGDIVYLDNLMLEEVVFIEQDSSAALVNTGRVDDVIFTLESGTYVDQTGASIGNPVVVPPWSAQIVIRNENLVTNGGMEGVFNASGVADGFSNNSSNSTVIFSDETTNVFRGSHAQKIECTAIDSDGRVQLNWMNLPVTAGNEYMLATYLKQMNITDDITLRLGKGAPTYGLFFEKDMSVGADWRRYAVSGYATEDADAALFGIYYNSTGTLYVDEVSVKQLYNKIENWSFWQGACATTDAQDWVRPAHAIAQTLYSADADSVSGNIAQKIECVATGRVQINSTDFDTFTKGEEYVLKMKLKGDIGAKTVRVNVYARTPDVKLEYSYEVAGITPDAYMEVVVPFVADQFDGESSYFTITINDGGAYVANVGDYLLLDDVRYYHVYDAYGLELGLPGTAAGSTPAAATATGVFICGQLDEDGNFLLSWNALDPELTYTIWSTFTLGEPWEPLAFLTNQFEYLDTNHTETPVIFYKNTAK